MKTIEQLWVTFHDAVELATAGDVQRLEMRRAFYAGFMAGLLHLANLAGELPEDAAEAALDELATEGRAFFSRGGV